MLQAFNKAIEIDPNNAENWAGKGHALAHLGRHEEALHAINMALEIEPNNIDFIYNKGLDLISLKRYEEALDITKKALEQDSNNIDLLFQRGSVLLILSIQEFNKNSNGNAIENLNSAMKSFRKVWDTEEGEIKEKIMDFIKELIDSKNIGALDISLGILLKEKEELTEFLEPISVALKIVKNKNIKIYYDLQIEKRDIVVDIVRKLTESKELLPEEYRKGEYAKDQKKKMEE
jgi:tetratricopeptide (TPR) repeat protein